MESTKTDLSSLNEKQTEAVVCDELRALVLAGAGSGKTKTLLQKIIYLVEEKSVKPSEILAITFTKNAANEMVDRLIMSADSSGKYKEILFDKKKSPDEKNQARYRHRQKYKWINALTINTFHSFCYSALRNSGGKEFDNKFKIIGDEKRNEDDDFAKYTAPETVFEVFHKLLIERCGDTRYLLDLKRYILDYMVDKIHVDKLQKRNFSTEGKYFTTLNGTKVRSKSEQYIADWLYRHSIKFEYEPLLNVKDFDFHPDFFIPEANVYIEHVSAKSAAMKNKEEQFEKGNLLLVKTYESMTKDSALFNAVLDGIFKNRLPSDYHRTVSLSFMEEFKRYHEDVKDFVTQVIRITDMIKVENIDLETVLKNARKDPHERIRSFYELALPLVQDYKDYCVNKSYLDFNDLISTCISLFKNYPDIAGKFTGRYKYILVDEFQDVNNLQVEMIKLLLAEGARLFCVGDDWQSIYGFRGSNVAYIIDFEKHFPGSKIIKLNVNYRSTQNIVGAGNEVISYNKFKIEKDIRSLKQSEHKIVVFAGNTEEENIEFCAGEVRELLKGGLTPDDIFFLYRRSKMYHPYFEFFRAQALKVQGKTIHAAKGLEAKAVFLIGLTEGYGGFPDIWLEDRIFQVIKKVDHDALLEEERRLFYAAITRAKDKLYLITERGNESGFLREIPDIYTVKTSVSLQPVVDKIIVCAQCSSHLEKLFVYCPYCGHKSILQGTHMSVSGKMDLC